MVLSDSFRPIKSRTISLVSSLGILGVGSGTVLTIDDVGPKRAGSFQGADEATVMGAFALFGGDNGDGKESVLVAADICGAADIIGGVVGNTEGKIMDCGLKLFAAPSAKLKVDNGAAVLDDGIEVVGLRKPNPPKPVAWSYCEDEAGSFMRISPSTYGGGWNGRSIGEASSRCWLLDPMNLHNDELDLLWNADSRY